MRTPLAFRLGVTHGALVAMLALLLVVTLQGLVSMLGVMSVIRDQRLSALDTEEQLHRAAWDIEVALRQGRTACADGGDETAVKQRIGAVAATFEQVRRTSIDVAPALRTAASRYGIFAEEVLQGGPCAVLIATSDDRRLALDENLTDAWIDRLHEVHSDIEAKEARAREIGDRTKWVGIFLACASAGLALIIARWTATSVTRPIAELAIAATRLGEGEFSPIDAVGGPAEVEALRKALERARQQLLELDRMKQSFLASVSHELRSPLGRLREALALLADGTVGALTPPQERVVALARRACEQEVRIVETLLDVTRVGSGMPVHRTPGSKIGRLVEAAIEAERGEATSRGVEIAIAKTGTLPNLRLDDALVERAIANLVRNAVSVSPRGGTVEVNVYAEAGRVRIEVHDRGPGVAPELADRVFQPFHAAAVAAAGRPAGIGLGLALVREVARAHGGDVTVKRAGETTIFNLEFPTESP